MKTSYLSTAIALALGLSMSPLAQANNACLGNDYEQPLPVAKVTPPTVNIVEAPAEVKEGETVSLTAEVVVDQKKGGAPAFYWCAEQGQFELDPNAPDYHTVKFIAPSVTEEGAVVRMVVQVGDGLGYVGYEVATLKILDTGNSDANNPAPVATITPRAAPQVGEPYAIELQLGDTDAQGKDTSAALSSALYYSFGEGEFLELAKGLRGAVEQYLWLPEASGTDYRLKLVTTDGNTKTEFVTEPFTVTGGDPNAIYHISGRIVDDFQKPVADAVVQVGGRTVLTTETGYWEIAGLPEGDYTATATKDGLSFAPQTVTLGNGPAATVTLVPKSCEGRATYSITDGTLSIPIIRMVDANKDLLGFKVAELQQVNTATLLFQVKQFEETSRSTHKEVDRCHAVYHTDTGKLWIPYVDVPADTVIPFLSYRVELMQSGTEEFLVQRLRKW